MSEKKLSFEEALQRLEEITRALESGEGDLDSALKLYQEGVGLIRTCSAILENAEQSVKILKMGDQGKITLADFNTED